MARSPLPCRVPPRELKSRICKIKFRVAASGNAASGAAVPTCSLCTRLASAAQEGPRWQACAPFCAHTWEERVPASLSPDGSEWGVWVFLVHPRVTGVQVVCLSPCVPPCSVPSGGGRDFIPPFVCRLWRRLLVCVLHESCCLAEVEGGFSLVSAMVLVSGLWPPGRSSPGPGAARGPRVMPRSTGCLSMQLGWMMSLFDFHSALDNLLTQGLYWKIIVNV